MSEANYDSISVAKPIPSEHGINLEEVFSSSREELDNDQKELSKFVGAKKVGQLFDPKDYNSPPPARQPSCTRSKTPDFQDQ